MPAPTAPPTGDARPQGAAGAHGGAGVCHRRALLPHGRCAGGCWPVPRCCRSLAAAAARSDPAAPAHGTAPRAAAQRCLRRRRMPLAPNCPCLPGAARRAAQETCGRAISRTLTAMPASSAPCTATRCGGSRRLRAPPGRERSGRRAPRGCCPAAVTRPANCPPGAGAARRPAPTCTCPLPAPSHPPPTDRHGHGPEGRHDAGRLCDVFLGPTAAHLPRGPRPRLHLVRAAVRRNAVPVLLLSCCWAGAAVLALLRWRCCAGRGPWSQPPPGSWPLLTRAVPMPPPRLAPQARHP